MSQGLIYIFTGDGKGKTSAALGVAARAVCAGLKVAWVAWYKEHSWPISEKKLSQFLPIDFYLLGKGFYIKKKNSGKKIKTAKLKTGGIVVDDNTLSEHQQAARQAFEKAREILQAQMHDVLVCDELNNALHENLVTKKQVKELLKVRNKTHIILTGRDADSEVVKMADLVSEIRKIKHPYDIGISAVKGLDF